jgi:quinol monooxygenase YgiN
MTILVTGTIDFDPAKRDEAIAAVTACMAATRAEAGNEGYVFSGDLEDEGRFHVTEHWASQEDIDAHMATPHMATLMGQMGTLGVTAASLTKWEGATPSKLM